MKPYLYSQLFVHVFTGFSHSKLPRKINTIKNEVLIKKTQFKCQNNVNIATKLRNRQLKKIIITYSKSTDN